MQVIHVDGSRCWTDVIPAIRVVSVVQLALQHAHAQEGPYVIGSVDRTKFYGLTAARGVSSN